MANYLLQKNRLTKNSMISDKIEIFKRNSKGVLGVFQQFDQGCPLRFRVNVYQGCSFGCKFCFIRGNAHPDRRIIQRLPHDIELALKLSLQNIPVMISCSTEPLQLWEQKVYNTEKVLQMLSEGGFPLIILTQNPSALLSGTYLESLRKVPSVVEVTIPSITAGPKAKGIFNTLAPPANERLSSMKELKKRGVALRLRLDPIIPRLDDSGPGQTQEDIKKLVKQAKSSGAQMVISKPMRLNPDVGDEAWNALGAYYRRNAVSVKIREGELNLISSIQEELLRPVYLACKEIRAPFCSCVASVHFPETVTCCFPLRS